MCCVDNFTVFVWFCSEFHSGDALTYHWLRLRQCFSLALVIAIEF